MQVDSVIGPEVKELLDEWRMIKTDLHFVFVTVSATTMEKVPQANTEGKSQLLDALLETSVMEQRYVPEAVLPTAVMESHHLDDNSAQTGGIDPCQPQDLLINSGMMEPDYPQEPVSNLNQTCLVDQCHLQDAVIQTGIMESGHPQDHSEHNHQDMNSMLSFSGYDMLDLSTLINDSLDSWPDAFISNGAQDDLEDLEGLLFSQGY